MPVLLRKKIFLLADARMHRGSAAGMNGVIYIVTAEPSPLPEKTPRCRPPACAGRRMPRRLAAGIDGRTFLQACGIFLFLVGVPHLAYAAVRINEIAWMGGVAGSSREWIELANDSGAPVSFSGWRIEATTGAPNITLSGVIAANGYFLIERMTDEAVPDVSADLVLSFGAGLSNKGETLQLKDGAGVVVDTVDGGENWVNIGGDNSTKQTAQRLENVAGGWITGTPTPRAPNIRPQSASAMIPKASEAVSSTASSKTTPPISKNEKITDNAKGSLADVRATTKAPLATLDETATQVATTTVLWRGNEANVGTNGFLADRNAKWFFLAFGLALSLFAGFIIVRSGRKKEVSPAEEYAIIEDIIEGEE